MGESAGGAGGWGSGEEGAVDAEGAGGSGVWGWQWREGFEGVVVFVGEFLDGPPALDAGLLRRGSGGQGRRGGIDWIPQAREW